MKRKNEKNEKNEKMKKMQNMKKKMKNGKIKCTAKDDTSSTSAAALRDG